MNDLKYWKEKIQEKRKHTDFQKFLLEIGSHMPIVFHKHGDIISKFPKTSRIGKILDTESFEKSRDDLTKSGIDYDENLNLFQNFEKLFLQTPLFNVINHGGNENSLYADMLYNSSNVYLSTVTISDCKNVLYSFSVKDNTKDVVNSLSIHLNSEYIYMSAGVLESFKIFYSRFINNCNNIWLSSNLVGCSECILCDDLENCSYYIENKKYEKEDYFKKKTEILKKKEKFLEYYKSGNKQGKNIGSKNTTGSSFFNSEDVSNGYFGYNVKSGNNIMFTGGINGNENIYDCISTGAPVGNDFYGIMGANGDNLYCSKNILLSSNIFYSYNCNDCSFCIGCIGLKNKSYCILNKQYTKEQWNILADKIFTQMEQGGILGDFFPGELNPFYFNDTMAGILGNFTKEEVEAEGYMWRNEEIKVDIPEGSDVISTIDLKNYQAYDTDGSWRINPDILKKVIKDKQGNYYRIVQMEYDFLIKHGLPLPEIHWMDRMKVNFGV